MRFDATILTLVVLVAAAIWAVCWADEAYAEQVMAADCSAAAANCSGVAILPHRGVPQRFERRYARQSARHARRHGRAEARAQLAAQSTANCGG